MGPTILAFVFLQVHLHEGYQLQYIKPRGEFPGHHVYVTDGTWAFDGDGWIFEAELIQMYYREWREEIRD